MKTESKAIQTKAQNKTILRQYLKKIQYNERNHSKTKTRTRIGTKRNIIKRQKREILTERTTIYDIKRNEKEKNEKKKKASGITIKDTLIATKHLYDAFEFSKSSSFRAKGRIHFYQPPSRRHHFQSKT